MEFETIEFKIPNIAILLNKLIVELIIENRSNKSNWVEYEIDMISKVDINSIWIRI